MFSGMLETFITFQMKKGGFFAYRFSSDPENETKGGLLIVGNGEYKCYNKNVKDTEKSNLEVI